MGYIDFIITEDSDLIPFGSKKIFYKFENDGSGIEIE
jgi:5'-3' exonuclease